jgi:hypothetical protein
LISIEYLHNIDKQFQFNRKKNLFSIHAVNSLRFSPETLEAIKGIDLIDTGTENLLIGYLTDQAIREFCSVNQYYTFDRQAREELRYIYIGLFANLKRREISIEAIAENHYDNLVKWLQDTNPFAEKMYSSKGEIVEPVTCLEYSYDLQMEILQLNLKQMPGPVLDIGCGKLGNLVKYLRQQGIEAYGFDRFAPDDAFLDKSDWFEYTFEKDKWGTIISNLGFSNHFLHHHYRKAGNFIEYAKKYMDILNALKAGGSFHYAPDLPFIESFLDEDKYLLTKQSIGNYQFQSIKIIRLK